MADWNPTTPAAWERAFGLVALPYFGRNRTSIPPGTHLMMQVGDPASFAIHLATPDRLLTGDQPLAWAWSSNVRHAIVLDPATRETIIRRCDDPSYKDHRVVASVRDAKKIIADIERS